MSAEAQTLQIDTTPVKEQPSAIANAAAADATSASASATPARLNANAKSFVPVKMDETALSANGPAADATNPKSATKPKQDRSPKAPGAVNGKKVPPYSGKAPLLPPNAFLVPNLMQPFMPGMPMPPFMPNPMMGHHMMMAPPMMMNPMMGNPMMGNPMMGNPMMGMPHGLGMGLPPNQIPHHLHHHQLHHQPPPPHVGGLPQTPLSSAAQQQSNLNSMASANLPTNSLMTLLPASPIVATGLNASMNVSVGNASLAALRSNAPAKFACVILIGLPSSGKTTVGRQLVRELSEDKMGWSFFSGSDYLKETATKKAPWETTRDVFDGLGGYIDDIIANQTATPTRGLVIDKNVKGMEDIYYLSALLKSKGLMLNGIVSFDSTNDGPLLERMGGDDGRERLKFYRAILNRIQEGTKTNNLFHVIDSSKPLADSLKALRTQVLGCSAMQNVRSLSTFGYSDTNCQLVDDYLEYNRVMTAVSTYAKTPKANQFPGLVNYTPLSQRTLDERKFRTALADGNTYSVRRKTDGTKFVLYHENGQLYLVPRHQRAILRIPTEAWIGFSLSSCGPFILDGELVRLSKESGREKFLVFDVLFWAEKGSTLNICRGSWKERQDRLRSYLVSETNGFFQVKTNIVIVHQKIVGTKEVGELFENVDYPVEGIVFNSTIRREDPVLLWRSPKQVTVDFRLGTSTSAPTPSAAIPTSPKDATTTYTYELEVFDSKSIPARYAPYTRYGGVDVTISTRQTAPAEGSIATCALQFEGEGISGKRSWRFLSVRPDLAIPIFKLAADELLDECIVPREKFIKTLVDEKLMVDPAKVAPETVTAQQATVGRVGFGINLNASTSVSAVPIIEPPRAPTLRDIVVGVRPKPENKPTGTASATETALRQVASGATVTTSPTPFKTTSTNATSAAAPASATAESNKTEATKQLDDEKKNARREVPKKRTELTADKPTSDKKEDKESVDKESSEVAETKDVASDSKRRCCDCRREKNEADGRVDKSARHRPFYCFGCWAKVGTEFCQQCSEFAKGHRDTASKLPRGKGSFYCEPCWGKYEERKGREGGRGKKKDDKEEGEETDKKETAAKSKREPRKRRESATPAPEDSAKPKEGDSEDDEQKKNSRRGKRGGRPARGVKVNGEADSTPGATPTASSEPKAHKEAIAATA